MNHQTLRQRQERIQSSDQSSQGSPSRSQVPLSSSRTNWAVVRSIDTTENSLMVQLIDYKDSPPVSGSYKTIGEAKKAWPLPTNIAANYEDFVWPETLSDGSDNPVTLLTVPVKVSPNSSGDLMVEIALKADASLLPDNEEVNECSF